jgi:hypothetical protein
MRSDAFSEACASADPPVEPEDDGKSLCDIVMARLDRVRVVGRRRGAGQKRLKQGFSGIKRTDLHGKISFCNRLSVRIPLYFSVKIRALDPWKSVFESLLTVRMPACRGYDQPGALTEPCDCVRFRPIVTNDPRERTSIETPWRNSLAAIDGFAGFPKAIDIQRPASTRRHPG